MSTAAAIPTRQLHPLVTLDYRVRMVSMVVVEIEGLLQKGKAG
jgi:hypothetical protein